MAHPNPTLSLWLDDKQTLQLGRKGFAGTAPVLKVHMHDMSHAVTLAIPGYRPETREFDLPAALQSGMFDLVDAETKQKVTVPTTAIEAGEMFVKAHAPLKVLDLKLDPCDAFWTQLLTPGRTYEIGWAEHGPKPEVHRNGQRLPIRLGEKPVTYTLLPADATPLTLTLSITPTAPTCHMSGTPPFGLVLRITSHATTSLTVCLHKTPFRELHGLEEIVEVEDEAGQHVEFDWGIGCWGFDVPPSPDDFTEFEPEVPFERTFWLKETEDNGMLGDLTGLEVGKRYRAEVSKVLLNSFWNNRLGRKEELVKGGEKEREERWRGKRGELVFMEVSEPFVFETV